MDFFDELRSLDVNVDEGLERVMGDGDLYAMMLDMFVTAIDTTPIRPEDFDGGALDELIGKVHTLKARPAICPSSRCLPAIPSRWACCGRGSPLRPRRSIWSCSPSRRRFWTASGSIRGKKRGEAYFSK